LADVEIKGLDLLLSKLDKVATDEATRQGITRACELVDGGAKENLHKNGTSDTGELAQSVHYEVEGLTGVIGTNKEYAPYVEIGTGIFSSLGDGRDTPWVYWSEKLQRFVRTVGQHPQPYLRPALVDNIEDIKKVIFDEALKEARKHD
jgi:HK97 gp10 family phage protein